MPFTVIRNDITRMSVDAIVNTANPKPVIGSGTDAAIHKAAGPQLLQARQCVGPIQVGHAAITPAYKLNAKYVIHTVGPVWIDGDHNEEALLQGCYENALRLAADHRCRSIAFPLISTGNYGFPKDKALSIAISVFSSFLAEHDIDIYLVVFNRDAYRLSESMFQDVASYIDQNYVDTYELAIESGSGHFLRRSASRDVCQTLGMPANEAPCGARPLPKAASLEDMFRQADAGFTETLLSLIDKSGHKDSTIYKKANISKQLFSKIRNNPNYKPNKTTAVALALALELNIDETNDLIGRAGYTLSNSNKFDLIIRYFIENRNYNIVQINIALYEFDQMLLKN